MFRDKPPTCRMELDLLCHDKRSRHDVIAGLKFCTVTERNASVGALTFFIVLEDACISLSPDIHLGSLTRDDKIENLRRSQAKTRTDIPFLFILHKRHS